MLCAIKQGHFSSECNSEDLWSTRKLPLSQHYDYNMETFMTKTPDIQRRKHILSMVKASVNREMKTERIAYI